MAESDNHGTPLAGSEQGWRKETSTLKLHHRVATTHPHTEKKSERQREGGERAKEGRGKTEWTCFANPLVLEESEVNCYFELGLGCGKFELYFQLEVLVSLSLPGCQVALANP